jgi:hypothetical protein
MKSWLVKMGILSCVGLISLSTERACGQYYSQYSNYRYPVPGTNPYASPRISPYLNLLRGGNPAMNYYLGVIPDVESRANAVRINQALTDLDRRASTPVVSQDVESLVPTLAETGHPTAFMTLSPYFGTGTQGIGAGGTAAGAQPRQAYTPQAPKGKSGSGH